MVVFADLDDDLEPPEHCDVVMAKLHSLKAEATLEWYHIEHEHGRGRTQMMKSASYQLKERLNPNKNAMTEALACYPIISEIASLIDLNTLDNLSRTCRQTRENLLQFRKQLITQTLRCCNDDVVPNGEHTLRYRARAADWYFVDEGLENATGKVGSCARDMVSECRRCSRVVCRNCTIKPPAPALLLRRHRRLCQTCIRAPLTDIISPHLSEPPSSASSISTVAYTIKRSICTCPTDGVWLCQPCGRGLRSADTTYESIWRWRASYGAALGGLGTGIGEGNRSSECGRAAGCLAARLVEEEIDCDAEDARENDASRSTDSLAISETAFANGGSSDGQASAAVRLRPAQKIGESVFGTVTGQMGPGYARHEIEGIGGVVKKKLVRMVLVGACVTEWEDEKEQGRYLVREIEGRVRSWCGWCWRVIPGAKERGNDKDGLGLRRA